MKTNVIVHGLNWSGSSAVYDLLREYSGIGYVPGEFDDFRRPGLIGDHLENAYQSNNHSLIEKQIEKKDKEYFFFLKRRMKKKLHGYDGDKIGGLLNLINPNNTNRLYFRKERIRYRQKKEEIKAFKELKNVLLSSSSLKVKIEHARNYIENLGKIYAENDEYLLFDQGILTTQHTGVWPEVFAPFKLIIVYRDPRDQLAELMRQKQLFYHMRSPIAAIFGSDKEGAIKMHIEATKKRLEKASEIAKDHGPGKVLFVCFEDFITEHQKEKKKIENFIGLEGSSHEFPQKHLRPKLSRKNIGIHEQFLSKHESQMLDELSIWYNKRRFN